MCCESKVEELPQEQPTLKTLRSEHDGARGTPSDPKRGHSFDGEGAA